jgi:putative ATPase
LQENLFEDDNSASPLAERLRPQKLETLLGQHRIVGPQSLLRQSIQNKKVPSLILWGPPGCGKTTLAEIIKEETKLPFFKLSAVHSGVKDVKEVFAQAKALGKNANPILFIDEIHRFNKSQQDSLLQAIEEGIITLIGATTENPSFEVNSALLSRCQLLLLAPLNDDDLNKLIDRSLEHLNISIEISSEVREKIISQADGDARYLINQIEWLTQALNDEKVIDQNFLDRVEFHKPLRYDKSGEEHYNLISVFHKSIRGSDPDAALYWLHRMLKGGEDPRYLLRRMQRMATEDIGLADPQAIVQATSCQQSYDFLGVPEGLLALDQLALYLALAPKSNTVEISSFAADDLVNTTKNLPVPKAFRNAVNKTGKKLGYGDGYIYDHDTPNNYAGQNHLPTAIKDKILYHPKSLGEEGVLVEKWNKLREKLNQTLRNFIK